MMEPLLIIVVLFIFQIISYRQLDKRKLAPWKYLILIFLLVLYMFVLPNWLIRDNADNGPHCGMPALGIVLAFWVFGGGGSIIIHFVYILIKKIKQRKSLSVRPG